MKPISLADIVFLEFATTLCFLVVTGIATVEQFLTIGGVVIGSFYTHKAQNKNDSTTNKK